MSKIDVHHHIYPPFFTQALENAGGDPSGWYIPPWTVELDHKFIAAAGVKTAILSVTAPGSSIEKDPAKAAALARAGNEYMAKVRDAEPARYGFFTALPDLFDTEACLREIAYGLDVLGADGVTLFSRYGEGHDYLGSVVFRPIWAELSRRKAVIFIHPTSLVDKTLVNQALPQPMFDYPHETGRTAIDLLTSGVMSAYPGCKIILSHAGGTLPYLIYRVAGMLPHMPVPLGMTSEELLEQARESSSFDTAISANPVTLRALFAFAKPGRVLFGSDFPNAPSEAITYFTERLEKFAEDELAAEEWAGVQFGNGLELFPRLKSLWGSK